MNALEYQAMELNFRQQTMGKHQRLQNQGIYDHIQILARQADHKMFDTLKEKTVTTPSQMIKTQTTAITVRIELKNEFKKYF